MPDAMPPQIKSVAASSGRSGIATKEIQLLFLLLSLSILLLPLLSTLLSRFH
jgi:hypothetical protein